MLVIHPNDPTTRFLSALYDEGADTVIDQRQTSREVCHTLNHLPHCERLLLLGHGSDRGLFAKMDGTKDSFDRIIVGNQQAYYLRKHGANTIGIWCHASLFAEAKHLHGLFTGMIISEADEAAAYNVDTTQEEVDAENDKLAMRLRTLLNEDVPLYDIPERIKAMDDAHTQLTLFNYNNFHYL